MYPYGNAVVVYPPGAMQAPAFRQAPAFQPQQQFQTMIPYQQLPRPRMTTGTAGWFDLLDVAEGGLAIFLARPATVVAPPVTGNAAIDQANQVKYAAAVGAATAEAERRRILINEGARIARGVLRFLDRRSQMGRPLF